MPALPANVKIPERWTADATAVALPLWGTAIRDCSARKAARLAGVSRVMHDLHSPILPARTAAPLGTQRLFGDSWYRERDGIPADVDALPDYAGRGEAQGLSPGPHFDPAGAALPAGWTTTFGPLTHFPRHRVSHGFAPCSRLRCLARGCPDWCFPALQARESAVLLAVIAISVSRSQIFGCSAGPAPTRPPVASIESPVPAPRFTSAVGSVRTSAHRAAKSEEELFNRK